MAPAVKKVSDVLSERIATVEEQMTPLGERITAAEQQSSANSQTIAEVAQRTTAIEEHVRTRITRGPEPSADKPQPISILRLVRAMALERAPSGERPSEPWKEAGYEREITMHARTSMIAGTDSLGGYIVPTQYLPQEFIDALWSRTVLAQLGVRRLPGLVGAPAEIPRKTASATAYYAGEASAPTESNLTFGLARMYPKKLAALCSLSKMLVLLSSPAAESIIREDMTRVLNLRRELGVLQGAGGANEPLGLVNTSGIGSSSIDATPANLDGLAAMVYTVEAANADQGSLAWLMHPREWNTIRLLKDTTGRYLLSRAPDGATPRMLHGYPVVTTTQMPITLGAGGDRGRIIFGNWMDLIDGEWGGVSFDMTPYYSTHWAAGLVAVMTTLLHDVLVRQPASFVVDNTIAA